jgi:hypothetical protein
MRALREGLKRNLYAGTRLAFFMPVRLGDFRVSAGSYAALVAVSFAAWLAGGMVRGGFPGAVNFPAFIAGLGQLPLVLLACLLAATLLRDGALALAFAVLVTATDAAFEAVSVLLAILSRSAAVAPYTGYLNALYIAWSAVILLRAQYVASGWRGLRSLGASLVLLALLGFFVLYFPRAELWTPLADEPGAAAAELVREDIFHLQGRLLEERLADLEPERPGVADLYFVGAAPYGLQDTFVRELSSVKRLMDERFDTVGRSIMLANHPATLASLPLATATNLAEALGDIGDLINPDEDIVFLFLTTHGARQHELAFVMPPLELNQVNPTLLARMLADSGIKWRVIVLSACYSGGFIEALRDDNTLIVTAADATHSSFGCEAQSDFTWFSRAYFDQALRGTRSFVDAFARATGSVAEEERRQGLPPSNPQMHLGAAMKEKLLGLERRLESQDPGKPSVRAAR